MKLKKISACLLTAALVLPVLSQAALTSGYAAEVKTETASGKSAKVTKTPKYVFLFIGYGMSYPQIQATADYLGTTKNKGEIKAEALSFMEFPVAGTAQTYDSTSFAPDSASTATSISTGNKTYSGTINMDTTMTKKFETISEKLKKQKDYKIGVISTVNLNHATPAAFYAHQKSRNDHHSFTGIFGGLYCFINGLYGTGYPN